MRDENFVKDLKADNLNYTLLGVDLAAPDNKDEEQYNTFKQLIADNCPLTDTLEKAIDCTVKMNDETVMNMKCSTLLSEEEFVKANESSVLWYSQEKWSEPKYRCPKCNEGSVRKEMDTVYTSNPPCFRYECDKCGHSTFHHF